MLPGPVTTLPTRDRADACPGALQTHAAADGALARVRVPGGGLSSAQLAALAAAAGELGDGARELTSRGNVQLRGLAPGTEPELGDRLAGAGLLPSPTHERIRNVLASTLSGRTPGGAGDGRPWGPALPGARSPPARGFPPSTPGCAPTPSSPGCPGASWSPSTTAAATSPVSAGASARSRSAPPPWPP